MNISGKRMTRLTSLLLTVTMLLGLMTVGVFADESDLMETSDLQSTAFSPKVTYTPTLTDAERAAIHKEVEALSGDVGNMVVGDGTYDPYSLIGALATGSSYDSISRGKGTDAVPTIYPFPVGNNEGNQLEYDRKVAKLIWIVELAEKLGFPVVVQRQADKYVYVEIGDPDAPEMTMALSHLDSPTGSVSPAQLERWRATDGTIGTDPDAFHKPYVKDGWLYGAGVQDDSGPTLATLFAAKALMEAGVPMDRRIRIVMGIYEDGGPGTPTTTDTLNYMDIPYYTSNPNFYDNWAYKSLNREEMPIAAYTSDSRFPVVVGNSRPSTPTVTMDLSGDAEKAFRLINASAGITLREGDDTLKDIVYGSAPQIASRAVFTLDVTDVAAEDIDAFIDSVEAAATEQGWLPAVSWKTAKVAVTYDKDNHTIALEINTDVAMEMPTPQYGKNAIVWGMHLISKALDDQEITADGLQLKAAADGIDDLFFRDGEEGEAYIGKYMGIPQDLLRNKDNGVAYLTFAFMGGIQRTEALVSFYTTEDSLSIPLYIRSMHTNKEDYDTAAKAVMNALQEKGFMLAGSGDNPAFTAFSDPTLYVSHDNPLTALQFASYKASMESDPDEFTDVYNLRDITFPVGTTGGTLASNFLNKMTAFGAIIPGNERWWHTANERITVDSIVEMTKIMADGMLEMARYSGPAGAQLMWADIDGLNADRADLDLLDVTIGTYQDASSEVPSKYLDGDVLVAATAFDIPMWAERGNSSKTDAQFQAGHGPGGVYLPTDDPDFTKNTFVLPMRLEFKVERPDDMRSSSWSALVKDGFEGFTFNILNDGKVIPLTLPEGADGSQYFSTRVSKNDPNTIYISANLAITDGEYTDVKTVVADSKTDLYALSSTYTATNENPFPDRGATQERGFFLFGDGNKDARFISPDAIYVTMEEYEDSSSSSGGTSRYSLSFDTNGGNSIPSVSHKPGTTVSLGTYVPTRPGFFFAGWYTDSKLTDRVTQVKLTKSTTVYAKWNSSEDFTDVPSNAYYADAVEWAVDHGVTTGTSATTFSPNAICSRAQAVTFLWHAAGDPKPTSTDCPFTDVPTGEYYYNAVLWAVEEGITKGTSDTTFSPNSSCSRAQIMTLLWSLADSPKPTAAICPFTDVAADAYYYDAVLWAVEKGITKGTSDTTFSPNAGCTRAQIVTFLYTHLG